MTIAILLVLIAFAGLALLFRIARGRALTVSGPQDLNSRVQSIDIEAFRNLVDPTESEFLRGHLSRVEFRAVHRQRLRAAIKYISGAASNASILLRIGEAARRSEDPAIAEAGEKLVDSGLRLRLYAFRAMAKLYLGMIVPGVRISPAEISENYERMTRTVVLLRCLKRPTGRASMPVSSM